MFFMSFACQLVLAPLSELSDTPTFSPAFLTVTNSKLNKARIKHENEVKHRWSA